MMFLQSVHTQQKFRLGVWTSILKCTLAVVVFYVHMLVPVYQRNAYFLLTLLQNQNDMQAVRAVRHTLMLSTLIHTNDP